MIQHIKYLLIFVSILNFSCKKVNNEIFSGKEKSASKFANNSQENIVFAFYKSFENCENSIGYFTSQEANELYANKIIKIDSTNTVNEDIKSIYDKRSLDCIINKLGLTKINSVDIYETKNEFPFNRLVLFNHKYLVTSRDGYFFVFISEKKITNNIFKKEENNTFKEFDSILNHELVGLSIINDKESTPYKQYGIDTSSACFCDSPSLYIDTFNNELIIFNYCSSTDNIKNIKDKFVYSIVKIEIKNKLLLINTADLKISFEKINDYPIYKMEFNGNFPYKYVGSNLKNIFTNEPEKFEIQNCGDFDG